MMKRTHKVKKTISPRQFVAEFGEDFSPNMKRRLCELGTRCVLTRKDNNNILDLKHVEHTKYRCGGNTEAAWREYAYGQFVMDEGIMYFSGHCLENNDVMQAPIVNSIFNALDSEEILSDEGTRAKKVDDSNIDFVVDHILEACPEMSPEHMKILSRY